MKNQIKVLKVILQTIIGVLIFGVLFSFLFIITNETEYALNTIEITVHVALPLFFVAVILDVIRKRN